MADATTIRIIQQIHSSCSAVSTEDFFVEREFPITTLQPFNGLRVEWQDDGMEYSHSVVLDEITVDEQGGVKAYTPSDRTLYELNARGVRNGGVAGMGDERDGILRFLVQEAIDAGWSLRPKDVAKLERLPAAINPDERSAVR